MELQEINDLWQRFINGDDVAFSNLYNHYVHELFSYGLKIHGNEFLVKDCIQEVFIQLINKRKKLELTDNKPIYLFKSLRNKLLEELRSKNRRTNIAKLIASGDASFEIGAEQSTILLEEEKSLTKRMEAALNSLSDYQKEAIFLKYSQGLEYEKIAELLDINTASARTLIYRSLKKVKESLFSRIQILFFFFAP